MPLPARGHQIAFGNLEVELAAHHTVLPEQIRHALLLFCGLSDRLAVADVMDDIVGRQEFAGVPTSLARV